MGLFVGTGMGLLEFRGIGFAVFAGRGFEDETGTGFGLKKVGDGAGIDLVCVGVGLGTSMYRFRVPPTKAGRGKYEIGYTAKAPFM